MTTTVGPGEEVSATVNRTAPAPRQTPEPFRPLTPGPVRRAVNRVRRTVEGVAEQITEALGPMFAPQDESPRDDGVIWDENRAERRKGLDVLDSLPLPWHGAIPAVGCSSTAVLRVRPGGRSELRKKQFRDRRPAVRVDVVPVIHQRAARARQSALWARTTTLYVDCHHTFGPITVLPADRATQDAEGSDVTGATAAHDTGPPPDAPPPAARDITTTVTPSRGPNVPAGALAGGSARGRAPT